MEYRSAFLGLATVSLGLLIANAKGETPVEQPVPDGMVKNGCLRLPTGGQVTAPDDTWEWRVLGIGDEKMFMLVKPEDSTRIVVMHQVGVDVNNDFMRGFVKGMLGTSAKQGIQVHEPTFARVDYPVAGTYRFEARTTLPNGVDHLRVGYILPSGHAVMCSFQGTSEPPAVRAVAASIRPGDESSN